MPNTLLIFLLLVILVFCSGNQWLMEGDFITEREALERRLLLESTNSTTSVSSSMRVILTSPPSYKIHCVLAAALHMNGNVKITNGGIDANNVTIDYDTLNGNQDMLFVLIESHSNKAVRFIENLVQSPRITILYDHIRDWRLRSDVALNDTGV